MTVLDHKANPRRDMREAIVGVQVGKRALFGKCLAPNVVSLLHYCLYLSRATLEPSIPPSAPVRHDEQEGQFRYCKQMVLFNRQIVFPYSGRLSS